MDYALRFFIGGLVVSFFALFWAMSCVRKVSPDCLVPPLLSPWEALDAAGAAWGQYRLGGLWGSDLVAGHKHEGRGLYRVRLSDLVCNCRRCVATTPRTARTASSIG